MPAGPLASHNMINMKFFAVAVHHYTVIHFFSMDAKSEHVGRKFIIPDTKSSATNHITSSFK